MRNRIINLCLTYGLDLAVVIVLVGCSFMFFFLNIRDRLIMLFSLALVISLFPAAAYARGRIESIISPIRYSDLYVQTVDSILNIESFDRVLRDTFDRVLTLIKVSSGLLIFYYHDKDEFNIFYQKNRRRRVIRRARVSHDNILFRVINGPDDIVVKSRMDREVPYERAVIDELERLSGELVVPVYYHDMFLGLIIVGSRKKRFDEGEIRLLKIFASKIAILSVNSYFFSEVVKSKDLEKEYELATKVQKKFLPDLDIDFGRIGVRVFHEASSLMIREFFDVFPNDSVEDDLRFSAYRVPGSLHGASILMPGIQALLQSFARMGLSPSRSLSRLKRFTDRRDFMKEKVVMMYGSVRQNGECIVCNNGYAAGLLYRSRNARLSPLPSGRGNSPRRILLREGDVLIVSSESLHRVIISEIEGFGDIVRSCVGQPLGKLRSLFVKKLGEEIVSTDEDKLLVLIRLEARA